MENVELFLDDKGYTTGTRFSSSTKVLDDSIWKPTLDLLVDDYGRLWKDAL